MNLFKKQTISIGLCFALAVSTFSAFTPATAAAKAKLVKKKLTLTVGQLTAMLWLFFQKTIQKQKNIRLFICSTD